ncbi:hypothetical protein C0J52_23397 [Blattella germanica]|nr:hypothetical protein C0J52_23397 [Blattella germanica]
MLFRKMNSTGVNIVDKSHFEPLSVLGAGSYGKVTLVRKKGGNDDGSLYAMKVHDKCDAAPERLMIERRILEEHRIIYRDLKMENIMIDKNGHAVLADFDLCRLFRPHEQAIDWWALGVITYELVTGCSPFIAEECNVDDQTFLVLEMTVQDMYLDDKEEEQRCMQLFSSILTTTPVIPVDLSPEIADFISKMLDKDPRTRLGGGREDAEELKRHPFFRNINWSDLKNKKIAAPFKPTIANELDLSNFPEDITSEELSYSAPGGIPSSQVYAQLLAIYLYQNDLCNAKYLWKRIPQNVKNSHAELVNIWKVGQKMWQRDFPGLYAALNVDWSENVGNIMNALLGGIPSSQVYAQLLAIYLYQNDLCNAKYLWKRIPQNVKNSHAELVNIWKVGQKMWQRDFPGVYAALNVDWSENVGNIMNALLENVRKRAVYLVSHAYSSIGMDDLAAFVGMPCDQAVKAASDQGWVVDAPCRMVRPCRPPASQNQGASSEDQLYKLTEFVSFLEN